MKLEYQLSYSVKIYIENIEHKVIVNYRNTCTVICKGLRQISKKIQSIFI